MRVPSCDIHNSKKSGDDEYLMYILSSNLPVNSVAERHFQTKIMRAMARKPALSQNIYSNGQSVIAKDENGVRFETLMFPLDGERLDRCFENISRALFFFEFNERWLRRVRSVYNFILSTDPEKAKSYNETSQELTKLAELYMNDMPFKGENDKVFKYKIAKTGDNSIPFVAQCKFYGASTVTILYGP